MKDNKTRFLYFLYSDKTRIFDQSEEVQGPINILCILHFVQKMCKCKCHLFCASMQQQVPHGTKRDFNNGYKP